MLIEILPGASGAFVAYRCAVGTASARWRGPEPPVAGPCQVEWTVDQADVKATGVASPMIRMDGQTVMFRGRLSLGEDGVGTLEVDGSLILVDVPEPVSGGWAEVRAPVDSVGIYPYDV